MEKLAQIINYSIKSDLYAEMHYRKPEDLEPDPTAE
jgi:hypothetical protein